MEKLGARMKKPNRYKYWPKFVSTQLEIWRLLAILYGIELGCLKRGCNSQRTQNHIKSEQSFERLVHDPKIYSFEKL